jgi:hypothetical protein
LLSSIIKDSDSERVEWVQRVVSQLHVRMHSGL